MASCGGLEHWTALESTRQWGTLSSPNRFSTRLRDISSLASPNLERPLRCQRCTHVWCDPLTNKMWKNSGNYTGQTSRRLVTRIKEHRLAIRNCNVKASVMSSRCADTGHIFDLAGTRILNHGNRWTARLFKEAWLSNKTPINKCMRTQLCERQSINS